MKKTKVKFVKFFILVISFLFSLFSLANEVGNPLDLPLGFTEPTLGNTGVALGKGAGSVFYNPSSLSAEGEKVIFASSMTTITERWSLDESESGSDNPTIHFGFSPNFVLGVDHGDWAWALSFINNENTKLETEISEVSGTISKSTLIDHTEKSFLMGATGRYRFSPRLAFGLSFFLQRYTDDREFDIKQTDSSNVSDFIQVENNHRTVVNLFAVLGASYRWSDALLTGIRIQTPGIQLQGEVDHFSAIRGDDKSQAVNSETSDLLVANQDVPLDIVLGHQLAWGGHVFLLDLGVQFPVDFESIDGEESNASLTERVVTKATLRFSFGYQYHFSDQWNVNFGLRHNPSAISTEVDDLAFQSTLAKSNTDKSTVTLGVSYFYNSAKLTLGGYFTTGTVNHFDTTESTEVERSFTRSSGGGLFSVEAPL